ncbi:MAG: hypothetical protein V5A79_06895 [Candidatus Bipolaricaulota bacterium]
MIGTCRNYLLRCPMCGYIHGGTAFGGVEKRCCRCPHEGVCEIDEGSGVEEQEKVCEKDECRFQWFLEKARIKNINI